MKKVKYIALDFDGTMLNSSSEVSEELVNKLIQLQKKDYKIILASGRSIQGMMWLADKIKLGIYGGFIVSYNGSQIYEYKNQSLQILRSIEFTKNEVNDIHNILKDDINTLVTYDDTTMSASNIIDKLYRSSKLMGLDLDNNFIKNTPKIIIMDTPEYITKIYGNINNKILNYNDNLNVFSSVEHIIEITPPASQKGQALKMLAQKLNTTPDNFICFGDNGNDVSMFEFCKYSVAVANGIEEVKTIATHHTLTNDENGVYHFLEENF